MQSADPNRDVVTQDARWQSSATELAAINYFAPLNLTLRGDLLVEVVVAIDRNGRPLVFPDTARALQGDASNQQAGQLAERIISGWQFTPAQMEGAAVMHDYRVRLKVSALGS